MLNPKVLAIYGSPSSGKTITSTKIAALLAKQKKNVIIITLDSSCPVIPYICECNQEVSIGTVLTKATMVQSDILKAIVPYNEYIGLIGYMLGENEKMYPKIIASTVVDFLIAIKPLADYIIIDTRTDLDTASKVSLELADKVLKLGTADLKGLSYFYTTDVLLADSKVDKSKQVLAVSNLETGQEWENVYSGNAKYILPHTLELKQQMQELSLFTLLQKEESQKYMSELSKLVEELFEIKTNKKPLEKTTEKAVQKRKKGFKLPFAKQKGEF